MITYHPEKSKEYEKDFGRELLKKVERAATNRTARKARTYLSKMARSRYAVKAAAISRRTKLNPASTRNPRAELRFKGPRIGLINFSAKEKKVTLSRKPKKGQAGRRFGRFRTGATVKIRKGGSRKLVTSKPAFIATGKNGNEHVFARRDRGRGRKDIFSLKTFSVPEMIANVDEFGEEKINEFVAETYGVEFDQAMRHFSGNSK